MKGDEFDLAALDELRDAVGPETFSILVRKCADDVRVRLEKLTGLAAPAHDLAATRSLAHQLKGLFLQFGATAASRDAVHLETCAAEETDDAIARLQQSGARALTFFEGESA